MRFQIVFCCVGQFAEEGPEGLTPLVEWEWWSNFMPWLLLVQVKGAMDHPIYQVVVSVRLKVPWASHGRLFTKNSVAPPLLLHQSCLTLAPPQRRVHRELQRPVEARPLPLRPPAVQHKRPRAHKRGPPLCSREVTPGRRTSTAIEFCATFSPAAAALTAAAAIIADNLPIVIFLCINIFYLLRLSAPPREILSLYN